MNSVRAVVISEKDKVELREVTLKTPGPDDAVIQTAYTSISAGTERMLLGGQMPHPMLRFPVVPGYETVGRVVEIGDNVDPAWMDRWVYVGGALCYEGVNSAWGGQAERLFAPAQRLVPLDGLKPQDGVLLALAATALHGVDLLQPQAGDRVLVLGQGPVGQLAARFARQAGAWVAVSDRVASRLARSAADVAVNVAETPLNEAVTEPVHAIIEATGSMAALSAALSLLAPGGTILLLGYYDQLQLPYMPLFLKEAALLTAKEWKSGDLIRCRDRVRDGTLDLHSLLTHHFPVAELDRAYDVALNAPDCLKVVMDWT